MNVSNNAIHVTPWMVDLPEPNKYVVFLTLPVSNIPCGVCKVGRILFFIPDNLLCMISCFIFITKQHSVDNVRKRYILINWLGLKGLKIISEFSSITNKINCLFLQLPNHARDTNLMCSLSFTKMERKKPLPCTW